MKINNIPSRPMVERANDLSGSLQGAGGVGGLLSVASQGTNAFVAFDGNGNVGGLVKTSDGTVVGSYGPFGEVIRQTGPMAKVNPFRFSTKYQDDESGLVCFGRRYLLSSSGFLINRDPIEESGGINLYGYANNNPVNLFDKTGLSTSTKCGCKCKSVSVTEKPLAPPGIGMYIVHDKKTGDPYVIYGNLMTIKWDVEGDPSLCKFEQNETGYSTADPQSGQPQKYPFNYGPHVVSQSYSDYMGLSLFAPQDNGNWSVFFDLQIDFVCNSSDGSTMTGNPLSFFSSGIIHF